MSYNHLTPEERGKIEAYLDEGVSQAEIARRLNRNRSIFRSHSKMLGEKSRQPGSITLPGFKCRQFSPYEKKKLWNYYQSNCS